MVSVLKGPVLLFALQSDLGFMMIGYLTMRFSSVFILYYFCCAVIYLLHSSPKRRFILVMFYSFIQSQKNAKLQKISNLCRETKGTVFFFWNRGKREN